MYAGRHVHGDVREAYIMVKRDGMDSKGLRDIILVDVDWAGEENTVNYPSNITSKHRNLWRPKSIKRGGLISYDFCS